MKFFIKLRVGHLGTIGDSVFSKNSPIDSQELAFSLFVVYMLHAVVVVIEGV